MHNGIHLTKPLIISREGDTISREGDNYFSFLTCICIMNRRINAVYNAYAVQEEFSIFSVIPMR